ncbi:MAG: HIRAN domain-containing protein [Bacteroidales bacterium]|nr:HIRAN domain-containing protein [Bacteroidales bacterium]
MNRIDFLKQLLVGGSSIFLSGSYVEKKAEEKREVRLTSRYIAGFQYYRGAEIENQLRVNDSLVLKREPGNRHDCYAVEVYRGNDKLGYLPREENRVVARMMDQGIEVKGRITKINPESSEWHRVKMKVYYEMA